MMLRGWPGYGMDETQPFQRQHDWMRARWRDRKEPLHACFGGRVFCVAATGWPAGAAGLARMGFGHAGAAVVANPALGRDEPGGGEMGLMVAKLKNGSPHGFAVSRIPRWQSWIRVVGESVEGGVTASVREKDVYSDLAHL
jgi:hypothetical protein